jgi:hypothetical protein
MEGDTDDKKKSAAWLRLNGDGKMPCALFHLATLLAEN